MFFQIMVDVVVFVHFVLLAYVVLGGFLVLRWRHMLWPHLAFVLWGVVSSVVQIACPLTQAEAALRAAAGMPAIEGDFVTVYLAGVLYPEHHINRARAVALLVILISWAWVALRARRARLAERRMLPPAAEMLPAPVAARSDVDVPTVPIAVITTATGPRRYS